MTEETTSRYPRSGRRTPDTYSPQSIRRASRPLRLTTDFESANEPAMVTRVSGVVHSVRLRVMPATSPSNCQPGRQQAVSGQ